MNKFRLFAAVGKQGAFVRRPASGKECTCPSCFCYVRRRRSIPTNQNEAIPLKFRHLEIEMLQIDAR